MEIKCEFGHQRLNCSKGFVYKCHVTTAALTSRCVIDSKEFKSDHQREKSNVDVEFIGFWGATVHYLPIGLDKIFARLIKLDVHKCGLKEISQQDLIGLENLKYLSLTKNPLTLLPDDLFVKMKKLQSINLSQNQLKFMSSRLFAPIPERQLVYLNLTRNARINAIFDPKDEKSVKDLAELMSGIDSSCAPPEDEHKIDESANSRESLKVSRLARLWDSNEWSDFTIIADLKEFPVHKCIISTMSTVLSSIFKSDKEVIETNRLVIEGFTANAVEAFLRFFYTEIFSNDSEALEVFALASEYNYPELRTISEKSAISGLNNETALQAINFGNLYDSDEMVAMGAKKVKEANPEWSILDSPGIPEEEQTKTIEMWQAEWKADKCYYV